MVLLRVTCLTSIFLLLVSASAMELRAQSTLIPLTTRRDMVFDHSGRYLYVTTSDGFVRRYSISTGQLEAGYNLGGSLNGIDITPDDLFLLVAQNNVGGSQGTFHKINSITGAVTNISYDLAPSEA